MAVTGPKTDLWLVKLVGAIITLVGVTIPYGGGKEARGWRPLLLMAAVGFPVALGAVDVVYAVCGVISKIYLADAVVEAVIDIAWTVLMPRQFPTQP